MVMTFTMFGGPASLICIGCENSTVELGYCFCSKKEASSTKPDSHSTSFKNKDCCQDCTQFTFPLKEAPVQHILSSSATAEVSIQHQSFTNPTRLQYKSLSILYHPPPGHSASHDFTRHVRLLI